jgi:hypothetical protein
VSEIFGVTGFTTAAQPIAGKPRSYAFGRVKSYASGHQTDSEAARNRTAAEGVELARELPGTGSKAGARGGCLTLRRPVR